MTRAALIQAFNALAEAAASVAIELEASEQPERAAPPSATPAAAVGGSVSPPAAVDTSKCPAHGIPYTPSKNPEWQPYCSAKSDDPAWSNAKGYCSIKPSSARKWLEIHGAAA